MVVVCMPLQISSLCRRNASAVLQRRSHCGNGQMVSITVFPLVELVSRSAVIGLGLGLAKHGPGYIAGTISKCGDNVCQVVWNFGPGFQLDVTVLVGHGRPL